MTADTHERCTDRIAEASDSMDAEVIINIQGDEPLVRPEMLDTLIPPLLNEKSLVCTNLMSEIRSEGEHKDANVVKTVCDLKNNALYFSREPVPFTQDAKARHAKKYKQLGIIAFRKEFLMDFSRLPPSPLETLESVDMLRAIEHGYTIRMVETPFRVIGVDTPEDLVRARTLLRDDPLLKSYL